MKTRKHLISILVFLVAGLAPRRAASEVLIKDIQWRIQKASDDKTFDAITQWNQPPIAKWNGKIQAVLTVVNRGPKPAEGVLLRYSVSSKLAVIADSGDNGVWTVSFWQEVRKIPLMRPNQVKEISIDNLHLPPYLKEIFATGFWPKTLRIDVMAVPRLGESLKDHVIQRELPVVWKSDQAATK